MRRFAAAVILCGLVALGASTASAVFIWSWDFEVDPTTEWTLNNLSWTLAPPGTPNKTSFQVVANGNASITTIDYLPYFPQETLFLPYVRDSFVPAPSLGRLAINVATAVDVQLIGYDAFYTPIGTATLASWPSTVGAGTSGSTYPIGPSNPIITAAWGSAPQWVKVNYLVSGASAGNYFNLDSAEYSVVPEPGTLLIGAALTGLSTMTLRRRAKKVKAA